METHHNSNLSFNVSFALLVCYVCLLKPCRAIGQRLTQQLLPLLHSKFGAAAADTAVTTTFESHSTIIDSIRPTTVASLLTEDPLAEGQHADEGVSWAMRMWRRLRAKVLLLTLYKRTPLPTALRPRPAPVVMRRSEHEKQQQQVLRQTSTTEFVAPVAVDAAAQHERACITAAVDALITCAQSISDAPPLNERQLAAALPLESARMRRDVADNDLLDTASIFDSTALAASIEPVLNPIISTDSARIAKALVAPLWSRESTVSREFVASCTRALQLLPPDPYVQNSCAVNCIASCLLTFLS